MKHSKSTKAIALLMSMTMITSVFVGNTLSRYVTSVSSTDSARVAVWGINAGEDTVMNLFDTKYLVDGKEIAKANDNGDSTFDKIMAPGTSGEAAFSIINFEQDVAPEVAYEVKISLDDSEVHEKIKNNPSVQWKLDSGAFGTWDELKTAILSLSGNAAGRHVYGPGQFATAFQGTQEHKIAWQWLMDNDETITVDGNPMSSNEYDTYMGNLALTNDLNAIIKVSITAQQVDDLVTNEYILDGADQTVDLYNLETITIRSSADFSTFEGVEVNNQLLTRDVDYTAEEGSTVITLTEEYLSKLDVGTYIIDIISNDVTATTKFNVIKDNNFEIDIVSGTVLSLRDIAPSEKTLDLDVSGVDDLSTVNVSVYGKNLFDPAIMGINSNYISRTVSGNNVIINSSRTVQEQVDTYLTLPKGTYTISNSSKQQISYYNKYSDSADWSACYEQSTEPITFTLRDQAEVRFRIFVNPGETIIENLQLECGSEVTDYVPYVVPTNYSVNLDGTVSDIDVIDSGMTIMSDNKDIIIECEYLKKKQ